MKIFGKNKILATLLLSASTIGIENIESEAFSKKYVLDKNGCLDESQQKEIDNIEENSVAFKKYIRINENTGKKYKQTILLTLAGIRNENNDIWKSILKALKKTKKKLIIRFSNNFNESNQTAYSTTSRFGNLIIVFNKRYFELTNKKELQGTLCHEIGHVYMESILINSGKKQSWWFEDRYIEDFIDPSEQTTELIEFSDEYRLYKNAVTEGQLNEYGKPIYTNSGEPLTRYGLRSHDDSEMIADSMKYHLFEDKNILIISSLASHAACHESKMRGCVLK